MPDPAATLATAQMAPPLQNAVATPLETSVAVTGEAAATAVGAAASSPRANGPRNALGARSGAIPFAGPEAGSSGGPDGTTKPENGASAATAPATDKPVVEEAAGHGHEARPTVAVSVVEALSQAVSPRGDGVASSAQHAAAGSLAATALRAESASGAATHGPHPIVEGVRIDAVPVELGMKSLAGVNRFEIRLTPDDLGRIDVRLDIASDGTVKASLTADRPETLAQLQRDTGALERAFEQAGLKTDGGSLAFTLRDPGSGGSWSGQGTGAEDRPGGRAPSGPAGTAQPDEGAAAIARRATTWSRASGIDLHV